MADALEVLRVLSALAARTLIINACAAFSVHTTRLVNNASHIPIYTNGFPPAIPP